MFLSYFTNICHIIECAKAGIPDMQKQEIQEERRYEKGPKDTQSGT
jgi:hypothetical protein